MIYESSWKTYVRRFPATSIIILALIVLHILTHVYGKGATDFETARQFGAMQSNNKEWTEFPYLLTSTYQHIGGVLHLASNLIALYIISPFIERVFGTIRFVILFNLTGFFGGLVTLLFTTDLTSSGASSAVFGFLGIYIALMVKQHPLLTKEIAYPMVVITAVNIISTFLIPGISITGHLGGLLAGMLLGMWIPASKTLIKEGFFISFFKTIITTGIIFAILLIPQNVIKSHSFIDVATQVGLGDYVTGKKKVALFNLHRDPVLDELNWMIEQYNEKSVPLFNGLVEDYNNGINIDHPTAQQEAITEKIAILEENIEIIHNHSSINETNQVQNQLLIMNEKLLEAAKHAQKTLETMTPYESNAFLSKMQEVEDAYNQFHQMLEELRDDYEY
ncbi:rhomboid family intramembrane serine protease [Ureibacillus manganicus]|uniref:rhomboid family intramembrane serine protease n=1 Tax=Ureibacillus manganicus TaxID=1266064 RepID=UPI000ADF3FFD|nr:rhomboid family intramembrane serine protease [Ureibacillus manganicus]